MGGGGVGVWGEKKRVMTHIYSFTGMFILTVKQTANFTVH